MFIGTRIDRNIYTRHTGNKEITYFRDREILSYKCDDCGKEFEKQRNGSKEGRAQLMHFCSSCFDFSKSTLLARNKKTDQRIIGSVGEFRSRDITKYIEVWTGIHSWHQKNLNNSGWIRQHIFVIQEELGHIIPDGYVVHHIDGDKRNNKRENLALLTVQEHNNAHAKSELLIFELVKKGIIKFDTLTKLYDFL
jgi:DNA-directed RNA polymerase subunit RPC12/RpoP